MTTSRNMGRDGPSGATCPVRSVADDRVFAYDYVEEPSLRDHLWELAAGMADRPEIFWSPERGGYWVVASARSDSLS